MSTIALPIIEHKGVYVVSKYPLFTLCIFYGTLKKDTDLCMRNLVLRIIVTFTASILSLCI